MLIVSNEVGSRSLDITPTRSGEQYFATAVVCQLSSQVSELPGDKMKEHDGQARYPDLRVRT